MNFQWNVRNCKHPSYRYIYVLSEGDISNTINSYETKTMHTYKLFEEYHRAAIIMLGQIVKINVCKRWTLYCIMEYGHVHA